MKKLECHPYNPSGGIWIVHDGKRQMAEVEGKTPQGSEHYAKLFAEAPEAGRDRGHQGVGGAVRQ